MKKLIVILCAAFALTACNQEQGGAGSTGEQPSSGRSTTTPTTPSVTSTNEVTPHASQGGANSPSGIGTGSATSGSSTNAPNQR